MKTTKILISICLAVFFAGTHLKAQVTIGSQNPPHAAAGLDIQTATKGFKLPSVALDLTDLTKFVLDGSTDKATAAGLMVFNTSNNTIYVWNGTVWVPMSTGAGTPAANCPSKLFSVSVTGTIPLSACPGYAFSGITLATTGGKAPYTYSSPDFNTNGTIISGIAMGTVDKVFEVKITDADGCYTNFSFIVPLKTSGCTVTTAQPVTLPTTPALTFLDRNLGVATNGTPTPTVYNPGTNASPTGYLNGDYYQWGRQTDGHEKWNSQTIIGPIPNMFLDANGVPRPVDDPFYGMFITNTSQIPFDWRDVDNQNSYLWAAQTTGAKTSNDPCPTGYRVPTHTELTALVNLSAFQWNAARRGLYYESGSVKFFMPGIGGRNVAGDIYVVGDACFYRSSTAVSATGGGGAAMILDGSSSRKTTYGSARVAGYAVRCVKQ